MKLSAAQVIARIQNRFDLGRQTARHTPQSLVDMFNDSARDVMRTMFARGSKKGLKTVTFLSSAATDTVGTYPGQRVDNFAGGASPVFAERIRSVEWLGTNGTTRLREVSLEIASDGYGGDAKTGDPVVWFPVGPIEVAAGASVGVCVSPRLASAKSFRITYLPTFTGIAITPDVGCEDMTLPLEAILQKVGVLVSIRDEDTSLTTFRKTLYDEAIENEIAAQELTQISEIDRTQPRGLFRRGLDLS